MKIALDLDNTIDAAPKQMQSLMSALKSTGHDVTVLTGSSSEPMTEQDWQDKANYLNGLGCGACWDSLVVLSHANGDTADLKAKWCKDNSVDILIDNSKDNAKAATAAGIPLVLVPWATRS
jgi:hypothetical protein